jgi:hypothetical protein
MHLAQVNNTLGAEIDIAAQATVLRKNPSGQLITNETTLCNCSKYGNPDRNSDPKVSLLLFPLSYEHLTLAVSEFIRY